MEGVASFDYSFDRMAAADVAADDVGRCLTAATDYYYAAAVETWPRPFAASEAASAPTTANRHLHSPRRHYGRGHMEDHGLSDSLAWRVMAGLSVAWRIVLWPPEFYGWPLRVVAVVVVLFGVVCSAGVFFVSRSHLLAFVVFFFVVGSRFHSTTTTDSTSF